MFTSNDLYVDDYLRMTFRPLKCDLSVQILM